MREEVKEREGQVVKREVNKLYCFFKVNMWEEDKEGDIQGVKGVVSKLDCVSMFDESRRLRALQLLQARSGLVQPKFFILSISTQTGPPSPPSPTEFCGRPVREKVKEGEGQMVKREVNKLYCFFKFSEKVGGRYCGEGGSVEGRRGAVKGDEQWAGGSEWKPSAGAARFVRPLCSRRARQRGGGGPSGEE